MDLKQLRYFVAVAEELHFGRAAQRLFISQPALSFDIRKFEERLGVQLLARTNKMVALTNAGQVLLDEARKLLQQAAEVERMTQRSAHGLAGRLRIGFVNSMLYRGLPRAVERFEADHPAVEIILREMNTSEQVHAIARMQIDLGCAYWGNFPAEVVSAPIFSEPFVCCLPAGHALAHRNDGSVGSSIFHVDVCDPVLERLEGIRIRHLAAHDEVGRIERGPHTGRVHGREHVEAALHRISVQVGIVFV
jgi:DNA-binding transcriptional LysR family regulator